MIGNVVAMNANSCPSPTSESVVVEIADIVQVGKISYYGSQACVQYIVRLTDGRLVTLRGGNRSKEEDRWLKQKGRKIHLPYANRSIGYALAWGAVESSNT